MAVNELVQKVKERTGQKKTKMVPDTQVKIEKLGGVNLQGKILLTLVRFEPRASQIIYEVLVHYLVFS